MLKNSLVDKAVVAHLHDKNSFFYSCQVAQVAAEQKAEQARIARILDFWDGFDASYGIF